VVGDTILLKNGGRVEGTVVFQDKNFVRVRLHSGVTEIPRQQIDRIEIHELPEEIYRRRRASLKPDDAEGWAQLGAWCLERGDRERGVDAYRKALRVRPGDPRFLARIRSVQEPGAKRQLFRSQKLRESGDKKGARRELEKILDEFPETLSAAQAAGMLAGEAACRGETTLALTLALRALESRPDEPHALRAVRRLALDRGDLLEASHFSRALEDGSVVLVERLRGLLETSNRGSRPDLNGQARREVLQLLERLEAGGAIRDWCQNLLESTGNLSEESQTVFLTAIVDSWIGDENVFAALRECDRIAGEKGYARSVRDHFLSRGRVLRVFLRYPEFDLDEIKARQILKLEEAIQAYLEVQEEALLNERWIQIEELSEGVDSRLVARCVRRGRILPPSQSEGRVRHQFRFGKSQKVGRYCLQLPSGYTHDRSWPLVIELHDQGDSGERYIEQLASATQKKGFLLACPTSLPPLGWGVHRHGIEFMRGLLRDLESRYRIDLDRVYLSGFAEGGDGAWIYSALMPDRFAAFACRSGSGEILKDFKLTENLKRVPGLIIHGGQDPIRSPKRVRDSVSALEHHNVEHRVIFFPDRGRRTFVDQNDTILDWLLAHSRHPSSSSIVFQHALDGMPWDVGWIRLDEIEMRGRVQERQIRDLSGTRVLDSISWTSNPARVQATVGTGNRIFVLAKGVRRLTIFLDDEQVDFGRDVQVLVNGKVRFQGRLVRSFRAMVDRCRVSGNRDRVFWTQIDIHLPK
jgi:hypothetical protein